VDVEIRGIRPDEADAHTRAIGVGFGEHVDDSVVELERAILETDRALAAVDGDRFVGGSATVSFELSIPGAIVPCAGITSVSVHPTHRRRGILTAVMRRLLDDLRNREAISALWASEGAIYGRFGYGMATFSTEIEVPRPHSAFRADYRPSGSVRFAEREDAMKLMPPVYDRVMAGQPGWLSRNEAWWNMRFVAHDFLHDGFGKQYFFAVHQGPDGPDGYVAYRVKVDWEGDHGHTVKITELVAENLGAYADLWRFCLDIDLVGKVVAAPRSPTEPLWHLLADPFSMNVTLRDGLWIRPVDVGRALTLRTYGSDERLVLGVRDDFCPWNEGRYELAGAGDGAECRPTSDRPDVTLAVEDLGAVYLGGMSFRQMARAGRVDGDPEALARADRMFTWDPPPWCPQVF